MRLDIVAGRCEHAPVLSKLEGDLSGDALPSLEEADFRLSVVVAVKGCELPAIENGASFDLHAANPERFLVKQEARDHRIDIVRLVRETGDIVGAGLGKAA